MSQHGRGRKQRLDSLLEELDSLFFWGIGMADPLTMSRLRRIIDAAMAFPEPGGDPEYISGKSADYSKAAIRIGEAHLDVLSVAQAGLPAVWIGEAGTAARAVTKATGNHAHHMAETYRAASKELAQLAEGVSAAQHVHRSGVEDARAVNRTLEGSGQEIIDPAQAEAARSGIRSALKTLRKGVVTAEDAGDSAKRVLDKLASEARAVKIDSDHLTDADRIVLANAAVPGGDRADNEILTANDLERSAKFLDRMSPEDRATFDKLLDRSWSGMERAYLMKALAAGYGIEEIQEFSDKIHRYGNSPEWLQQHLTPIVTDDDASRRPGDHSELVAFGSQVWEQKGPTCVALSTVTTRAQVDPVYALQLTTGGHPGDPAYDNPQAFEERLRAEEQRLYATRDDHDQEGMLPEEGEEIADSEIGAHTGADYDIVELESRADRADVMPEIREAVNSGHPVPIRVDGNDVGHKMIIIGQEGDKLQIYNPWGFTTWVSIDSFIAGDIGPASNADMPTPEGVFLPR